jgi:hypothetical protein
MTTLIYKTTLVVVSPDVEEQNGLNSLHPRRVLRDDIRN